LLRAHGTSLGRGLRKTTSPHSYGIGRGEEVIILALSTSGRLHRGVSKDFQHLSEVGELDRMVIKSCFQRK
jgi:hypothetical protein